MQKENIFCFDLETTGLNPLEDEILQLTILDGYGNKIFDEYMKPKRHTEWAEAAEINKITPESVADKLPLDAYLSRIQEIFDRAELIVGYNCDGFDLAFLEQAGLDINAPTFDVMREYAPIHGEIDEKHGGYKRQKLQKCSEHYGYVGDGWHNSLEDTRATLHCFYGVLRDQKWQIAEDEIFEPSTMWVVSVKPEMPAEIIEISKGLESLQQAVGGYIEAVYPFEDPVALICNEEGKIQNLPLNRALYDESGKIYDVISGPFLITGIGRSDFCSLTERQAEKFMEYFRTPEQFVKVDGKISVRPMPTKAKEQAPMEAPTAAPKREKGMKL